MEWKESEIKSFVDELKGEGSKEIISLITRLANIATKKLTPIPVNYKQFDDLLIRISNYDYEGIEGWRVHLFGCEEEGMTMSQACRSVIEDVITSFIKWCMSYAKEENRTTLERRDLERALTKVCWAGFFNIKDLS